MARLLWTEKRRIGPAPRLGHAMAFDLVRGRTVLFGGGDSPQHFFGDTWEWDGEHWTQLDDIGPSPRWRHALAYDSIRRQIVLFGGQGDGDIPLAFFADTWEWDGEAWTHVANGGPSNRLAHAMTFDGTRGRTILFGGVGATGFLADTWEWNGDEWVQVEDAGPPARADHAMAFDDARGRLVLFGGRTAEQVFGDTWEWDGTAWTQMSSIGPPPAAELAMASTGNRILIFGGLPSTEDGAMPMANTWEWDGRHWTIRQDVGPGGRWDHAMAYDTARRRSVLLGGNRSALGQAVAPLGDTWEQFERVTTIVTPPPPTPPTPPALQTLTIPAAVDEGRAFPIEVALAGPAVEAAMVQFAVVLQSTGATMLEFEMPVAIGASSATSSMSGVLFPGNYTFTARLGTVTRTAPVEVRVQTALTLTQLQVTPGVVPLGLPFEIQVTLSGPVTGSGLFVPTLASFGSGPDQFFRPVPVPVGASAGTVTIDPIFPLPTEPATITGTLGGVVRSAMVTFGG